MKLSELKEYLHYCPDTGIFTWVISPGGNVVAVRKAGYKDPKGYITIRFKGVLYLAHRLAYFYMTCGWPVNETDHINHVRDDNRWCNLREVTSSQNKKNQTIHLKNRSGITGVHLNNQRNKWVVKIWGDGDYHSLYWGG